MKNYSELIMEVPVCPDCGSMETVSAKAVAPMKESGKIERDAPSRTRQLVTPLEEPQLISLSTKVIVSSFDICLKCGRERCVRAEVVTVPVKAGPMPGMNPEPPGGPFGGFFGRG